MARKKASIGNCPGCGYALSVGDFECPQCGRVIFLDSSKDPDVEIARIQAQERAMATRVNRATDLAIEREREKTKRKNKDDSSSKHAVWAAVILFIIVGVAIFLGARWSINQGKKADEEVEEMIVKIETAIKDGNFDEAEKLLIKFEFMGQSTEDQEYVKKMHKRLTQQLNDKKDSSLIIFRDKNGFSQYIFL